MFKNESITTHLRDFHTNPILGLSEEDSHESKKNGLVGSLEDSIVLIRLISSLSLLITLCFTFGLRGVNKFLSKLQNLGYETLPSSDLNEHHQNRSSSSNLNLNQSNSILSSGGLQSRSSRLSNSRTDGSADNDEDGIVPVVVPVKRPRRGLTYLLKVLIIASFFLDGLLICLRAVIEKVWEPDQVLIWRGLDWYVLICLVSFLSCTLAMSLEEKASGQLGSWSKGYTRSFTLQALISEFVILILALKISSSCYHSIQLTASSSNDPTKRLEIYDILHLLNSGLRLILIAMLFLSHTKLFWKKEFVPISPSASIINSTNNSNREENRNLLSNQQSYGTFTQSQNVTDQTNNKASSNASNNGNASNGNVLSTKALMREPPKPTGVIKMMKRIKVLFPYLWPRNSRALQLVSVICFLLLFVGRGINILVPISLGRAVEDLSVGRPAWIYLGVYVCLRFFQGSGGIVSVLQQNLWIPVAQYADRSMSMMSFTHLLDLSLSYHTRRKTAEVLRILDRGSAINQFFQLLIFSLVPIFLDISLAAIYLALRFDILLSTMLLLVMIAYTSASVVLTQKRTAIRREMIDKDKYTRGIQGDSLLNWETIAWFNTKGFETNRYLEATIDYQRSEYLVMSSLYILNLVQNAIISVALLIGCFSVAFQVSSGHKTVGDFVLFVSYIGQLIGPLNQLGTLYRVIQQNLTDTDNLMKLLAEPKEIEDRPNAQAIVKAKGNIEFDRVSFSYDGKNPALEDISFSVPAGSSVALVGESGSGKSTILRLLFRFYDPTSGSIKLDGVDIRDLTQASYRSQIGSVPQDAALFNDTIRYNIGYGAIGVKPDGPTMDDVVEAAKSAQIHNRVISFPDGYETRVGERGVRLSGGEKQRVAIARVMIRNPPVILLDEATSALDTTTEREIQEALNKLGEGRTTVAIAHRLSTIVNSDLILVVDKGKIVERGNHNNLLAAKGIYSDLWAKQIRAEVEAGSIKAKDIRSDDTLGSTSKDKLDQNKNMNGFLGGRVDNHHSTGGTVTPAASHHHG